eukprot:364320-Chlamydomonas_euryale.AAC.2
MGGACPLSPPPSPPPSKELDAAVQLSSAASALYFAFEEAQRPTTPTQSTARLPRVPRSIDPPTPTRSAARLLPGAARR